MLKKLMLVTLLCLPCGANSKAIPTPTTISWGNLAKFVLASGASTISGLFYYETIIEPCIITMTKEKGFAETIDFNKQFIQQNPQKALIFAIPLLVCIGFTLIARDYMKQIWENKTKK